MSTTEPTNQEPLALDDDLPPSYESQASISGTNSASFSAEAHVKDGKKHILLAATASVVAVKLVDIIQALTDSKDLSIKIILTDGAKRFFSGSSVANPSLETLKHLPHVDGLYTDSDDDGLIHVELRKWTDVIVVAPLDANTLAKITNGVADNLLLQVLRTWDPEGRHNPAGRERRNKYLVLAPALDPAMWSHPITKQQLRVLEEDWADLREIQKGPDHVKSPGVSDHVIDMKPWAKILRPRGNELMNLGDVVKEIRYQAKKFY